MIASFLHDYAKRMQGSNIVQPLLPNGIILLFYANSSLKCSRTVTVSISMNSTIHTAADLGKIVQAARKAQKLSQDDLAGLTGTGRRFISELERGKETAHLGKTLHVLRSLGISVVTSHKWKA